MLSLRLQPQENSISHLQEGGIGTKLLAQTDGKYLVAGFGDSLTNTSEDVLVARFNADGSLDNTFGKGGRAVCNYGNHDNRCTTWCSHLLVVLKSQEKTFTGKAVIP